MNDVISRVNTVDTPDMVQQLSNINTNLATILYLFCFVIGIAFAIGIGYVVYKMFKTAMY